MISWMVAFGIPNSSARRRIEICRSRITIRSTASMSSSIVMIDGRPIWECVFEGTFWILEFSHPLGVGDSAVRWSRVLVDIVQLLANFDGIQPFSGEKLYDYSMLNIQHFSKMKTHGPQNVIFSYERNEPIGPKLVYLNKNAPSIE